MSNFETSKKIFESPAALRFHFNSGFNKMTTHVRLFSLFLFLASCLAVSAANISGVVTDADGPLPGASVRLLAQRDSSYVNGMMTDTEGKFQFSGIKNGKYILETTYVGYDPRFVNVEVAGKNIDLATITMTEGANELAAITVTGVKTPIKVMSDTIEFNADSYKSQPNAVVEDLLKRLPGVEVGTDGSITANGQTVTKILIDGKEFFSDDPKVASKNLPVSMVDKLQVVNRKSDLARLTGVDDGEDETVINLTVKPGMQNGWFGTVEAGYGTDDRYQVAFNVNRFFNSNQLTFLGTANNTNDLGFTDGNGNRFRRFGGDNGINNSQSFGVNFNVGNGEILRVGGDVMYSHTDKKSIQRQYRQYLLPDDPYEQRSLTDSRDRGHNVRADFRMQWKPDSFNTLDFRPNFSYNQNDSRSEAASISVGKNLSLNRSQSDGKSYEFGGRLIYNYNFKKHRGRSLSLHANYRLSNVREYDDSYVYNMFKQFNDSLDIYDQYLDNHTWTNSFNSRVSWTEPIGDASKGRFLTLAYSVRFNWNNADKLTYDRPIDGYEPGPGWGYELGDSTYYFPVPIIDYQNMVYVDSLSNRFRNTTFQQDIRLGFKLVKKAYTLDAGVSLVPIRSQSINLTNSDKTIPERWVWNFAPYARFNYKFSTTTSLNAFYFGRSSQPSMSQLQPVADYSDPLNIVQGNPQLVPTFNHNIRARFQSFNPNAQRSIMVMLNVGIEQNSIVSKTTFDSQTGGRFTTYENVNGVWNARLMNMFSQPLRNKYWTVTNNIFLNYNQRVGYNNGDRNLSRSLMIAESPSIAFRPDNLELELRPNYSFQHTSNTVSAVETTDVHRFGGSFNATWYMPLGFVINSELNFTATRGYARGYDTDSWLWNASLSYQFLKGKQATVSVKAYDLLGMKKDINRTITATYIDDTQYNALTRYFMLSFTWKFNTFGAGNQPTDRNERRWGPPGGPGPRR